MHVSLAVLDLADHQEFREFFRVYHAAQVPELSHPYAEHELNVQLIGDEFVRFDAIYASINDEVVGVAIAECPVKDNPLFAYLEVFVLASHRRQGVGSALLSGLENRCREDGRTVMLAETLRAVDADSSAGAEFFKAHGFRLDTLIGQRECEITASPQEPPTLEGFELVSWRGAPPDAWIDQYARLRALLNQEAPSGETNFENEYWDPARLRSEADQWHRQRRTALTVVAVAADGHLAGHTQLVFPSEGDTVFQWDTLVLPGDRGHGLGLALKRQALLDADDLLEGHLRIVTWNDAANEHMIAINEALGYRQTAWLDQWVKAM